MNSHITIIWFQRDLRLQDNLALNAGMERGTVVPVYIWSPEEEEMGAASVWWLLFHFRGWTKALRKKVQDWL